MSLWNDIKLLYGTPKKEKVKLSPEEKKRRLKRTLKAVLFFSIPMVILYFIVAKVYTPVIVFSDSVNFRVGYLDRTLDVDKNLYLYTYIAFPYRYEKNIKDRIYVKEAEGMTFIKYIACEGGQTLRVDIKTRKFFCDGEFIGKGREKFLNGQDAKLFVFNGKIPEGKYFVMGDKWNSFDSRYWGFVDKEDIVGIVKPLF